MTSAIYVCSECDQEYDQPGTCEMCLIKLTKKDEEVEDKEWSEEDEAGAEDEDEEEDEDADDALGLTNDEDDLMGLAEKEDADEEDFDDRDTVDQYM